MNGTLETIDGSPALRFERRLPHSPERVWRAVSEPDELRRWFVATVEWGPDPGEVFEAYGQRGEVTEVDPPRVLAWTWGDEHYRFDLSPDGEGCLLVFTHVFMDRALGAQHASGWEVYLTRLDAHLDGGFLSEDDAHEPVVELHERYAASFGLDPEVGRRSIARMHPPGATLEEGPALRFERRLAHPVERVWTAVADADERQEWFPSDAPLEVTRSEAPTLLVGTWFGDTLRFELSADGDGCILVFTHEFDDRDTAARTAAGWDRCFARLAAALGGNPMGEAESLQAWPEVHERYAERFGVDPEIGRQAFAQHPTQR